MKDLNKVAGNVYKVAADPADLLSRDQADPLYKFHDKAPGAPPPPAPLAMPDADSEAVAAARRRKTVAMKARGGRESTTVVGESLAKLGG